MSRVEGNHFLNFFFGKMENKCKTNNKNLKKTNGAWFYLLGGEGGGNRTRYLITGFINMRDYLRTSSALLTSYHMVKNVVKKV